MWLRNVLPLIFLFISNVLYTFSRPLEAGKLVWFRKKESICIRATSVPRAIKSTSVNRFPLRIFRAAISLCKIHPSHWLEHRTFNIEFLFRKREFTALAVPRNLPKYDNVLELGTIFHPLFFLQCIGFYVFPFHSLVFACWTVIRSRETGDLKLQKLIQGNFSPFMLLLLLLLFFQIITIFRNLQSMCYNGWSIKTKLFRMKTPQLHSKILGRATLT